MVGGMGGGAREVHNWMDRCFFFLSSRWFGCQECAGKKKSAVVYVAFQEIMSRDRCARVRQA